MQPIDFLKRVLPAQGIYYAARLIRRVGEDDDFRQFPQKNIQSLEHKTSEFSANLDTYYGTSTFLTDESRKAENVALKKTFYLDIDCGPDKVHKTLDDVERAWEIFKKQSGILPPNMILETGHGWHVYWVLDRSIHADQWKPIAELLKRITHHLNLAPDHSVTADVVRVLRVPGSRNFKDPDHVVDCEVIHASERDYTPVEFVNSIKKWSKIVPKHHLKSVETTNFGVGNLDGHGVPRSLAAAVEDIAEIGGGYADKYFKYVGSSCAILGDMIDNHGADIDEPTWKAALNILMFCEDALDWVHPLSDGHDGYSVRATEKKWAERLEFKKVTTGAGTCKELQAACGSNACASCDARKKYEVRMGKPLTSPISFCTEPKPELPHGYHLGSDGESVFYRDPTPSEDEPPNAIHVCAFGVLKTNLYHDTNAMQETATILEIKIRAGGKTKTITFDHALVVDYRKLFMEMSQNQLAITSSPMQKHFGTLMSAWSEQIQKDNTVIHTQSKFGWITQGKAHGFGVGGTTYWGDGSTSDSMTTDKQLENVYTPLGELEPWTKAAQFVIDQDRQQINAVLAASFGAPLMRFTRESGLVMSLLSECSASGKTAALKLGGSVWGDPKRSYQKMSDTVNSTGKRLTSIVNLPAYWDEVRGRDVEEAFGGFVFSFCDGNGKNRLNRDSKQQYSGHWESILVATSNHSLIGYVDAANPNDSNAGRMRLLEFEVPHVTEAQQNGNIVLNDIDDNYGVAGRIYAEYLAVNRKAIKKRVRKMEVSLAKKFKSPAEERFWLAGIASSLVGASIANDLQLVKFDMKKLVNFFNDLVLESRGDVEHFMATGAVSTSGEIGLFMNDMAGKGIGYVDMDTNGIPTDEIDSDLMRADDRSAIVFEVGFKSRRVKIHINAFFKWLGHRGKTGTDVLKQLEKAEPSFKRKQCTFGTGIQGTGGVPVPAFLIDLPNRG